MIIACISQENMARDGMNTKRLRFSADTQMLKFKPSLISPMNTTKI